MARWALVATIIFSVTLCAVPVIAHEFPVCVTRVDRITKNDRGQLSIWASYRIAGQMRRGLLEFKDALSNQGLAQLFEHEDKMIAGVQLTFSVSGVDATLVTDLSGCDPIAGSPKEFPVPDQGPGSITPKESAHLLLGHFEKKKPALLLALLLLERRLSKTPRRIPPTIQITTFDDQQRQGLEFVVIPPESPTVPEGYDPDEPGQGCQIGGPAPASGVLWLCALFSLLVLRRRSWH